MDVACQFDSPRESCRCRARIPQARFVSGTCGITSHRYHWDAYVHPEVPVRPERFSRGCVRVYSDDRPTCTIRSMRLLRFAPCLVVACSADGGSGETSEVPCSVEARANPGDRESVQPAQDNAAGCPAHPSDECTNPGGTCTYSAACQSQTQSVRFDCVGNRLMHSFPCELAHDFCPALAINCERPCGRDSFPACCRWDRPAEGEGCVMPWGPYSCGYWCDDDVTWTVATCDLVRSSDGTSDGRAAWAYDDACRGGCKR